LLLAGFAASMSGDPASAIVLLTEAASSLPKIPSAPQQAATARRERYQETLDRYAEVGHTALLFSRLRQRPAVIRAIDSLHLEQVRCWQQLDEYLLDSSQQAHRRAFSRPPELLNEDIEYALAAAELAALPAAATAETPHQADDSIEKQIEKIRQRLVKRRHRRGSSF
jgi:hypothetical protein